MYKRQTGTCTANIYVDKTAPTTPTGGNIGAVSGSNASASIKTCLLYTSMINQYLLVDLISGLFLYTYQ